MKRKKKYECKSCGKKYCIITWAIKHAKKKEHYVFKEIGIRTIKW